MTPLAKKGFARVAIGNSRDTGRRIFIVVVGDKEIDRSYLEGAARKKADFINAAHEKALRDVVERCAKIAEVFDSDCANSGNIAEDIRRLAP